MTAAASHPTQLTAEVAANRAILGAPDLVGYTTRFMTVDLVEPVKSVVLGFSDEEVVDRRITTVLLDWATGPDAPKTAPRQLAQLVHRAV